MKIFTNEAIRKIDSETIANEGITELELMERAASAVTYEIMSRWRTNKRIIIFAGPGNNGGDALAVARMLYEQGYHPGCFCSTSARRTLASAAPPTASAC